MNEWNRDLLGIFLGVGAVAAVTFLFVVFVLFPLDAKRNKETESSESEATTRIKVIYSQTIRGERGYFDVLIIEDSDSKKKYLAIQGMGIKELSME